MDVKLLKAMLLLKGRDNLFPLIEATAVSLIFVERLGEGNTAQELLLSPYCLPRWVLLNIGTYKTNFAGDSKA